MLIPVLLSACTLTLGGPSRMPDAPAPAEIPLAATAAPAQIPGLQAPPRPIALPPGFAISVFAEGLDDPRMLELGPDGQVYAVERGGGRLLRLPDREGDGRLDQLEIVAEGLDAPQSLAFYQDGSLYVAETERVLRLSGPDGQGRFQQQVIIPDLPSGGHQSRTLLFSPDFQTLYVSVGSSCNVCDEEDERRAAILRYNPDGSGGEVYARGLRNAVGLDIRPGTQELWATNNGRDFLGDDLPPETVYRIEPGGDYGWPRCHSGRIVDPEFGDPGACQDVLAPAVEMGAHMAPLGLEFYRGDRFPAEYQGDLFVALHGSWNRSVPAGYKVVRIPFDVQADGLPGAPGPVEDFAVGWLPPGEGSWGRPVDVLTGSDGSLFVSDDAGGKIYRIFYIGNE